MDSVFSRLILILGFASLGGLVFSSQALAKGLDSERINEHLLKTHTAIEKNKTNTELNNLRSQQNDAAEFRPPTNSDHGVNMQTIGTFPTYEYDSSYVPSSLDARIESELLDKQTTDLVVQKSWREIRRNINSSKSQN